MCYSVCWGVCWGVCRVCVGRVGRVWGPWGEKVSLAPLYYLDTLVNLDTCLGILVSLSEIEKSNT